MENMDRFIERYKARGWADELTQEMKAAQTTQQVLSVVEETKNHVLTSVSSEDQNKENISSFLKYCDERLQERHINDPETFYRLLKDAYDELQN